MGQNPNELQLVNDNLGGAGGGRHQQLDDEAKQLRSKEQLYITNQHPHQRFEKNNVLPRHTTREAESLVSLVSKVIMDETNYYAVLGLSPPSSSSSIHITKTQITTAYRKRCVLIHPDKMPEGDRRAFDKLSEAYDVLGDENGKKKIYDRFGIEGIKNPHLASSSSGMGGAGMGMGGLQEQAAPVKKKGNCIRSRITKKRNPLPKKKQMVLVYDNPIDTNGNEGAPNRHHHHRTKIRVDTTSQDSVHTKEWNIAIQTKTGATTAEQECIPEQQTPTRFETDDALSNVESELLPIMGKRIFATTSKKMDHLQSLAEYHKMAAETNTLDLTISKRGGSQITSEHGKNENAPIRYPLYTFTGGSRSPNVPIPLDVTTNGARKKRLVEINMRQTKRRKLETVEYDSTQSDDGSLNSDLDDLHSNAIMTLQQESDVETIKNSTGTHHIAGGHSHCKSPQSLLDQTHPLEARTKHPRKNQDELKILESSRKQLNFTSHSDSNSSGRKKRSHPLEIKKGKTKSRTVPQKGGGGQQTQGDNVLSTPVVKKELETKSKHAKEQQEKIPSHKIDTRKVQFSNGTNFESKCRALQDLNVSKSEVIPPIQDKIGCTRNIQIGNFGNINTSKQDPLTSIRCNRKDKEKEQKCQITKSNSRATQMTNSHFNSNSLIQSKKTKKVRFTINNKQSGWKSRQLEQNQETRNTKVIIYQFIESQIRSWKQLKLMVQGMDDCQVPPNLDFDELESCSSFADGFGFNDFQDKVEQNFESNKVSACDNCQKLMLNKKLVNVTNFRSLCPDCVVPAFRSNIHYKRVMPLERIHMPLSYNKCMNLTPNFKRVETCQKVGNDSTQTNIVDNNMRSGMVTPDSVMEKGNSISQCNDNVQNDRWIGTELESEFVPQKDCTHIPGDNYVSLTSSAKRVSCLQKLINCSVRTKSTEISNQLERVSSDCTRKTIPTSKSVLESDIGLKKDTYEADCKLRKTSQISIHFPDTNCASLTSSAKRVSCLQKLVNCSVRTERTEISNQLDRISSDCTSKTISTSKRILRKNAVTHDCENDSMANINSVSPCSHDTLSIHRENSVLENGVLSRSKRTRRVEKRCEKLVTGSTQRESIQINNPLKVISPEYAKDHIQISDRNSRIIDRTDKNTILSTENKIFTRPGTDGFETSSRDSGGLDHSMLTPRKVRFHSSTYAVSLPKENEKKFQMVDTTIKKNKCEADCKVAKISLFRSNNCIIMGPGADGFETSSRDNDVLDHSMLTPRKVRFHSSTRAVSLPKENKKNFQMVDAIIKKDKYKADCKITKSFLLRSNNHIKRLGRHSSPMTRETRGRLEENDALQHLGNGIPKEDCSLVNFDSKQHCRDDLSASQIPKVLPLQGNHSKVLETAESYPDKIVHWDTSLVHRLALCPSFGDENYVSTHRDSVLSFDKKHNQVVRAKHLDFRQSSIIFMQENDEDEEVLSLDLDYQQIMIQPPPEMYQ